MRKANYRQSRENIRHRIVKSCAPKQLRLAQQYFFVSCSLKDMILIYLLSGNHLDTFADAWAVQLNDTYPSIAVAKLMRLLVDEHLMEWETAWGIHGTLALLPTHVSPRGVGKMASGALSTNFNVKNSQYIYPAADLSEQIHTAGKDASGTGNMKLTMNGALTIGTLDGANVEIREEVGAENFFLFGLTVEDVVKLKARGYNPRDHYKSNLDLREAIDQIASGRFSRGDGSLFKPLVDSLLQHDDYLVLADYQSYVACQERVSEAFRDQKNWTRMSILNAARSGKFSSDRSIRDYSEQIWKVKSVPVELD